MARCATQLLTTQCVRMVDGLIGISRRAINHGAIAIRVQLTKRSFFSSIERRKKSFFVPLTQEHVFPPLGVWITDPKWRKCATLFDCRGVRYIAERASMTAAHRNVECPV